MHSIPPFSCIVEMHLRRRFPGRSRAELLVLYDAAWCWVSRHASVHMEPQPHPLLSTVALFYMLHVCEQEPKAKGAHLFNAHELLAIFP